MKIYIEFWDFYLIVTIVASTCNYFIIYIDIYFFHFYKMTENSEKCPF